VVLKGNDNSYHDILGGLELDNKIKGIVGMVSEDHTNKEAYHLQINTDIKD
jgi:hypothetical protein